MLEEIGIGWHFAEMFKALGDPARIRIFELLCSASGKALAVEESGDVHRVDGMTVGEVCCRITGGERITSTVSQQIKQLRQAGLIRVERRGKNMICSVNCEALAALRSYIDDRSAANNSDECCS